MLQKGCLDWVWLSQLMSTPAFQPPQADQALLQSKHNVLQGPSINQDFQGKRDLPAFGSLLFTTNFCA